MRVLRRTIPLLTLIATAAAVPALAQTGGGPLQYNATCNEATKDTDRAVGLFKLGQQFLAESNFDKAIGLFKDAYDTDCTAVDLLRWLADAFERAGNRPEEVRALKEYLRRVPNAPDKSTLEKRIINLGGTLDTPGASSSATTSAAPTFTAVPPASSATTPPTTTATTTAPPSATTTATAFPTTTPAHGHTIPPWIVVGAGGVATLIGGLVFLGGAGKVSDANTTCPNHVCPKGTPESVLNDGNSGRSQETTGGIIAGIGLAAVAGGLIWHFMEPTSSGPKTTAITPSVGPGYAGVQLGGAF